MYLRRCAKTFQSIYWNHVESFMFSAILTLSLLLLRILFWFFFSRVASIFAECKFFFLQVIAVFKACIALAPMCNWNGLGSVTCCGRFSREMASKRCWYCNEKSIYYWSTQIFQINWLVDTFLRIRYFIGQRKQCCSGQQR